MLVTVLGFSSDSSSDPIIKVPRAFQQVLQKNILCFSCEAVPCFFTKDVHFEFWKVTKLVPDCTVTPKTFQSSLCFNVAFLAAAKKCLWLMLGRAAPVSCCSCDLLVTCSEPLVPIFLLAMSLYSPWQRLICQVLMHPWTGTPALSTVFFCFSLLMNWLTL